MEHYKDNLYALLDGVEIETDKTYFCGVNYYKAIFISNCNGYDIFKLGREYIAQKEYKDLVIHFIIEPELDKNGKIVCYALKDMMK